MMLISIDKFVFISSNGGWGKTYFKSLTGQSGLLEGNFDLLVMILTSHRLPHHR